MQDGPKKLSPAIFAVALFGFFLPFVSVTCQGTRVASLTGIQLVTGTTVDQPSLSRTRSEPQKVSGEPLAVFALLCAIAGLGLSFLKSSKSSLAPALVGLAGVILLLALKVKIDNDALREGEGMLQVEYGAGFWLALLSFLVGAGWNGFLFSQRKKTPQPSMPA